MVKLIGLDTETVIQDSVHQPYSFQTYTDDFKRLTMVKNMDENAEIAFEKLFRDKTHRCWFVTFNLSFDAIIISRLLEKWYKRYKSDLEQNGIFTNPYRISCFYAGSRLIRMTIRRGSLKWVVVDLRNIFPNTNLARIGDILQLPKLEKPEYLGKRAPETDAEKAYFKTYSMRDAEICYKMAKLIQNEFGIFKSTCAGLAMRVYARDFCKWHTFYHIDDKINDMIRDAYHGGRTECFIRGVTFEPLKCYDVNSLYPYVMKTKVYPNIYKEVKSVSDVDLDKEGVTYCTVTCDTNFPPIAIKHLCADGFEKLCFVNGKYNGWFTNVELRELEQYNCGKVTNVKKSFQWAETMNIFSDYIDHFYKLKNEASKTGSPKRELYKIMLNGTYGKFGEHGETSFFTCENGKMINKELGQPRHAWYHSPAIAAYITAYARLTLWHFIKSLRPETVYYCDTDSIWTSSDLSNKVSDKLGDLKIEHECTKLDATFIRSKCYMYNNKVVMKGFHITDTWANLIVAIANGNLTRIEHRITKALEAQRIGKEALFDTDILKTYSISDDGKRKYLKKLDNKQVLMSNSLSLPLEVVT